MTGDRLPWGVLVPAVLAPNMFYATGKGAITPMIPLLAVHLGADLATAALVAALLTLGELAATLPASWLVVRIGEQKAMIAGAAVTIAGAVLCMAAPDVVVLSVGVLLIGLAGSVYLVARQAWVAITVPGHQRGRAYSLVAGTQRFGMLTGPFFTTIVLLFTDEPRYTFGVAVVASAAAVAVLLLWPTPPEPHHQADEAHDGEPGVLVTMWRQRGLLVRLGGAAATLSAMRTARQVIVPLWGADLGLAAVHITIVVAVCNAVEVVLFYTGGQIMDRFGRVWVAVPTMVGFAVAYTGLAVSSQLPGPVVAYIGLSVFMALANGTSSGVNATMGADLADPRQPATFLGSWRLVNESGGAAMPLLLAALTAAVSMPFAALTIGVIGFVGSGAMYRYMRRYLPRDVQ